MKKIFSKFHIGLRTVKTAGAVVISLVLAEVVGITDSRLIYAMLGAMAAVQPTFKASVESCLTQIVGVLFGAVMGVLLISLPIPGLAAAGIGIVLVITLYNGFGIRYAPGLPCLLVVSICTMPDSTPLLNALGRVWDTTIGLAVGMAINTLIFPYDNSRHIRATAESLDREVLRFLENMFDGDEILPDETEMVNKIDLMARQLAIFSDQKLLLKLRHHSRELETFRLCESKARELVARMTVLSGMGRPGRLNAENRKRLASAGAVIRDKRPLDSVMERDVVTNYHVSQILTLRRELMEALKK